MPNRNSPASTKTISSSAASSPAAVASGSDPHSPSPAAAGAAGAVVPVAAAPLAAEEPMLPLPAGKSRLSPAEQPQSAPAASSSAVLSPSDV